MAAAVRDGTEIPPSFSPVTQRQEQNIPCSCIMQVVGNNFVVVNKHFDKIIVTAL